MAEIYTQSLNKLIEEFGKLPGIGPKTAERLAFHILKSQEAEAMSLAGAIADVKKNIRQCENCYNLSEKPVCDTIREVITIRKGDRIIRIGEDDDDS